MKITVMGHKRAAKFLAESPGKYDVIMISSPDHFFGVEGSSTIPENAKNCLKLSFHDITAVMKGYTTVGREHVQEAIDFAKDRDELIVTCQAGISRSSAMAYIVGASKVGMIGALDILNPEVHSPNMAVIRHGADILGNPTITELIYTWKEKADELQTVDKWEL